MNAPSPTILLIEDEERLLLGLAVIMKRAGYRVHTASNGSAGLQLARAERPDLIVSDVMMPPPDGFQLRELLLEDPQTASIPFIFLTARTSQDDRIHGIENGADDYITKPFDRQELLARVRAVLRRNELGRQKGLSEAKVRMKQLQSTIIDNVSMEMQRPLAGLLSSLHSVLGQRLGADECRLTEFLESATDNANRLGSIIKDLVALVELQRSDGALVRQLVDIDEDFHDLIAGCVNHWRNFELRDLDLSVHVAPEVVIHAPRRQFRRALFHLLDNACKFSPDGGTIAIELLPHGRGGCVLRVTDQGPGVPPPLREKVFGCFFKGFEDGTHLYGGLGVGLTIARTMARQLGGDVTIDTAIPGGRVQLVIPPGPVHWHQPALGQPTGLEVS